MEIRKFKSLESGSGFFYYHRAIVILCAIKFFNCVCCLHVIWHFCKSKTFGTTGFAFEHLSCFPDRINTEFIQILDQHTIKMRVWERGSGETLSCGTGACAAAVAAMVSGCVSEGETAVELRGGRLFVTWDRTKNKVLLTGPAETVFEGTLAE